MLIWHTFQKGIFGNVAKMVADNLPNLHVRFKSMKINSDVYLMEWDLTLYTKQLPLPLASRVWDMYVTCDMFLFSVTHRHVTHTHNTHTHTPTRTHTHTTHTHNTHNTHRIKKIFKPCRRKSFFRVPQIPPKFANLKSKGSQNFVCFENFWL